MRRVALGAGVACALACGGGPDPEPDATLIEGVWVHEEDGAPVIARRIEFNGSTRPVTEYVYVDGVAQPYRTGFAYYEFDYEFPGGQVVDEALVIYYDAPVNEIGYDEILDLSDAKMTLRSPYATQSLDFEQVPELP